MVSLDHFQHHVNVPWADFQVGKEIKPLCTDLT